MGATGTTGIFIAFTGESSISTTTFTTSVPFTMCHEIGHRMAFARENEANFAAFLACSVSNDEAFRYSGYYLAFVYCYNALYRVDREAAGEVWQAASDEIKTDAAASRAHYQKGHLQGLRLLLKSLLRQIRQAVLRRGRRPVDRVVLFKHKGMIT